MRKKVLKKVFFIDMKNSKKKSNTIFGIDMNKSELQEKKKSFTTLTKTCFSFVQVTLNRLACDLRANLTSIISSIYVESV